MTRTFVKTKKNGTQLKKIVTREYVYTYRNGELMDSCKGEELKPITWYYDKNGEPNTYEKEIEYILENGFVEVFEESEETGKTVYTTVKTMKKSIVNMIKKVATTYGVDFTPLASVEREGKKIYDCIKLENSILDRSVFIEEWNNDLVIYNRKLEVERFIWHDSNPTVMEKAISLTMALMQLNL